ncbi:hypothetical protein IQ279_04405 [Streptomyces verrucosisporus]|uniref:hypothetical protein n=1 Tax=Streptomyces verrucosisporus TaxID=1695161 RepID=UPI0019D16B86|nr:hypothetical protein [Streptomyces verrucosisporus]MBN3928890.1 hypothetical protein [Streptomyces verrucosisporus]
MTRSKKVLAAFVLAAALTGGAAAPAMAENHVSVGPQNTSAPMPCENHVSTTGCGGSAETQSDNHVA